MSEAAGPTARPAGADGNPGAGTGPSAGPSADTGTGTGTGTSAGTGTGTGGAWSFGVGPLDQARRLAPILRRVTGLVLALEHEERVVDDLIDQLLAAEGRLAELAPADPAPRVGPDANADRRAYLDHSRAIGAFNPCFPEYEIEVRGEEASGTVTFPLAYEGPPGIVHGGFLAVFFDCVVQHHNCDVGVAGKTRSLTVDYRRPAPLLEALSFEIDRSVDAGRITSRARLSLDGQTLCTAVMAAVAGDRSRLPAVSARRAPSRRPRR